MYSVITKEEKIRKAKGVKKNVVKDQITHENYLDCLFEGKTFKHQMDMLRSYNHQIYGIKVHRLLCLHLILRDGFLMMELILWHLVISK